MPQRINWPYSINCRWRPKVGPKVGSKVDQKPVHHAIREPDERIDAGGRLM